MKECISTWLNEQFCGDRETIDMVYAEYKDTMVRLLDDLAAARQAGDAVQIDRALHTIKGSAAMVGDTEVSAARAGVAPASGGRAGARRRRLRAFAGAL